MKHIIIIPYKETEQAHSEVHNIFYMGKNKENKC